MLSTLTLGLCGAAAWSFARSGRRDKKLNINHGVLSRDLKFFICAYALGLLASFSEDFSIGRYVWAVGILLIYPFYLYKTFGAEGEVGAEPESLYLDRLLKLGSKRLRLIIPQVFLGLLGIVVGAYFFVDYIQDIADDIGFPPLVLSLIVCPIATELPEKINSILWVRNGKDTLALGNVTGALVFQSCIPVAFGVAFTSWDLDVGIIVTGITAITSAAFYLFLISTKRLAFGHLAIGALVYVMAVSALLHLDVHPGETTPSIRHPQAHPAPAK